MAAYFDSSVLLSLLLDESRKDEAYELWLNAEIKLSSLLLKIETTITLRRTYIFNNMSEAWFNEKSAVLTHFLESFAYNFIDTSIMDIVSTHPDLALCRSLDAIHVASALEWRNQLGEEDTLTVYTFDNRMRSLAQFYHFDTT
jgi:predicted nucleic acid-binding protein